MLPIPCQSRLLLELLRTSRRQARGYDTQMITRREAVRLLGSASAGAWYAATETGLNVVLSPKAVASKLDSTPRLAPGGPKSPERLALIDGKIQVSTLPLDTMNGLEMLGISEKSAVPVKIQSGVGHYRGRRAVRLVNDDGPIGTVSGVQVLEIIKGSDLTADIIEDEIADFPRQGAKPGTRGFIGGAFRVQDHGTRYEAVYLRMTNGRADDQFRRNHSAQYEFSLKPLNLCRMVTLWQTIFEPVPSLNFRMADKSPGVVSRLHNPLDSDHSILSEKRWPDERPLPSVALVVPRFGACFRESKIDERKHKYISEQRDGASFRSRSSTSHPFGAFERWVQ